MICDLCKTPVTCGQLGCIRKLSVSDANINTNVDDSYVEHGDKDLDEFMHEQPKKFSWKKARSILGAIMNSPVMGIIISITPKPFRNMLKWLKERFKEPSTYQGITVIASAIGFSISPELWEAIASVGASVIGLIQFIKRERQPEQGE